MNLVRRDSTAVAVLRREVENTAAAIKQIVNTKGRGILKAYGLEVIKGGRDPEVFTKYTKPEAYEGDHREFRRSLNFFVDKLVTTVPAWKRDTVQKSRKLVFEKLYDELDRLVVKYTDNKNRNFRYIFDHEFKPFVKDEPPPYDIWRLINLCAVSPFWRGLTIVAASYLWRTAVIDECKRLEIETPKLLETKGKITWD